MGRDALHAHRDAGATRSIALLPRPQPLGFLHVNLRRSLTLRNSARLTPLCQNGSLSNESRASKLEQCCVA